MLRHPAPHIFISATIALILGTGNVLAGGTHGGGHGQEANFGHSGIAADAGRSVNIVMTDNAFSIPTLDVTAGETIRFVLHNKGEILHEFALATPEMHVEHEEEMLDMFASGALSMNGTADQDHGGINMHDTGGHDATAAILVNPGDTAEFVWTFAQSAEEIEFACTIPGHYADGMVGPVHFTR